MRNTGIAATMAVAFMVSLLSSLALAADEPAGKPATQPASKPASQPASGEEKPMKNGKFNGLLSTLRLTHPRVYITPDRIQALKALPWITRDADAKMSAPHAVWAGGNLEYRQQNASKIGDIVKTMGLAYLVTGDKKYADRAIEELKVGVSFPEWGRNGGKTSDLFTAGMCSAFGIGYDWLYTAMSDEDRKEFREALITKGLNITMDLYKKNTYWVTETENYNPTCNRCAAVGALAIADEAPELCEAILQASLKSIDNGLRGFGPDGGYAQGGYCFAAGGSAVNYLSVIKTALGIVPGLEKYPGFANSGLFMIYLVGPTGRWYNYYDAHDGGAGGDPFMYWMADTFKRPVYEYFAQKSKADNLDTILWRSPDIKPQNPLEANLPIDRFFKDVDVVSVRSAWEDPQATWVGFKGGDTTTGHSHLDMGSFVMEALGQRWAIDLGMGDYLWPGYWGASEGGPRWQYYRTNTHGHNTLVINDQNQKYGPQSHVVAYDSQPAFASAIVDLTAVYPQTTFCQRGIKMMRGQWFLVRDELKAAAPVDVLWSMHTRADVEVKGDRAILTSEGKKLYARILSPKGAAFEAANVDALNDSPPRVSLGPTKLGVNKLSIHVPEKVQDLTLTVMFSPSKELADAELPKDEPLKAWKGWENGNKADAPRARAAR